MIEEFMPIIWVSVLSTIGIIFYKIRSNSKEKERKDQIRAKKEGVTLSGGLIKIIDEAPQTIQRLEEEIEYLKKKGATPEQLKKLESERDMLNLAAKYGAPLKAIAPITDKLIGKFSGMLD